MSAPLGIWLPECAYYEGLDELMAESGLRYAVLDGHGLLNADPRPRYGLYTPVLVQIGEYKPYLGLGSAFNNPCPSRTAYLKPDSAINSSKPS
jgi:hypothetical protein